jgi:hypothetical protein
MEFRIMPTTLKEFKKAYVTAKNAGAYEFRHDGKIFVTSYAIWIIEYLEDQRFASNRVIQFSIDHKQVMSA